MIAILLWVLILFPSFLIVSNACQFFLQICCRHVRVAASTSLEAGTYAVVYSSEDLLCPGGRCMTQDELISAKEESDICAQEERLLRFFCTKMTKPPLLWLLAFYVGDPGLEAILPHSPWRTAEAWKEPWSSGTRPVALWPDQARSPSAPPRYALDLARRIWSSISFLILGSPYLKNVIFSLLKLRNFIQIACLFLLLVPSHPL